MIERGYPPFVTTNSRCSVVTKAAGPELFGPWKNYAGMCCSNLGFVYELEREERPKRKFLANRAVAAGKQLRPFAEKGGR